MSSRGRRYDPTAGNRPRGSSTATRTRASVTRGRRLSHGPGLPRGLAPRRRRRRREIPTPGPLPRHGLRIRRRWLAGEGGRGADDLRG